MTREDREGGDRRGGRFDEMTTGRRGDFHGEYVKRQPFGSTESSQILRPRSSEKSVLHEGKIAETDGPVPGRARSLRQVNAARRMPE